MFRRSYCIITDSVVDKEISRNETEVDDSTSLTSCTPTLRQNGDLASLLDDGLASQSPAWRLLSSQSEALNPFEAIEFHDDSLANFELEFEESDDNSSGDEGTFLTGCYTLSDNNGLKRVL